MPADSMKRPLRLRRCQLAVPGSSDKMLTKAAGIEVDYVFLDLEDAVAPSAKPGARGQIVAASEWARLGPKDTLRPDQRLGDPIRL